MSSAQPSVVISQVYGSGGTLAGFPAADYVELFNRGNQPQDVSGWTVQVSAGADTSPWTPIPLTGVIAPGQFYLVQVHPMEPVGVPLPAPDALGSADGATLLASGGRVAIAAQFAPLANTPCPATTSATVIDFLAWGGGGGELTCAEGGAPAASLTATTALYRGGAGCRDLDDNASDFSGAGAGGGPGTPNPRSLSSNRFIIAAASPGNPIQGGDVTLLVVIDAEVPCAAANFGPIIAAMADTSQLGGPAHFILDDAGGDDDGAGDGLFGATLSLSPSIMPGLYPVPVSVTDGSNTLTSTVGVTVRPAPPPNDSCSGALNLGALSTPYFATVDNSTAQPDPNPICGTSLRPGGVWYRFSPVADGLLRLRETGPQDVLYGVYQTPNCSLPTSPALATCSGVDDPTFISVAAEQPYLALVCQADPGGGGSPPTAPLEIELAFIPRPTNDDCAGAIDLGPLGTAIAFTVDNAAALGDVDVTCNSGTVTRFGVWYSFTPPVNGALLIVETSPQDAVFGLFTGSCGAPVPLPTSPCLSNDALAVAPALVAGTRYLILVGNQGSSASPPADALSLTFTFAPAPTNDSCATARTVGAYPFSDSVYAPQAGDDLPDVDCNAPGNSVTRRGVWYRIPPGPAGRLVVTESSANDVVLALFDGASCPPSGSQVCRNEGAGSAVFPIDFGREYRLLVGLNSSTALPSLPYMLHFDLETQTGACCRGATCVLDTLSGCTGPFDSFIGVATACNAFGSNNAAPCCLADFNHAGGVSIQDVFDFLGAYFSGQATADINRSNGVSVQDIFDFLRVFFEGGC